VAPLTGETETSTAIAPLGGGVTLLDTGYLQPGFAAVYVIRQAGRAALVETGTARTLPCLLDALRRLGVATDSIDYIIPTHVHLDHAGGAGQLMALCPQAKLVAHPAGARHLIDPSRLVQGATSVYGERRFDELYGTLLPVDTGRVIEAPDGFTLDFAGRTLRFLDTPGHARHHFCVHDPASDGLFAGDAFGLSYPALTTPAGAFAFPTTTPVQFDPDAMRQTIDRLYALGTATVYLTHFGPVAPTPAHAGQLREDIDAFMRIAQAQAMPEEGRVARIERQLMAYLLDRLARMGCAQTRARCEALLAIDVELNAQGLDVWLSRQRASSGAPAGTSRTPAH